MKTSVSLLCAVAAIFISCGCASTQAPSTKGTLNVATLYWPPYIGPELREGGPATEIVTTALKGAGYDAKIHYIPWKDAITKTEAGEYDAVYPAYFSEERFKVYHVSEPFIAGRVALCARVARKIEYTTLESLKPYRIGVVAGYVNADKFDDAQYLNKAVGTSDLDNLKLLKSGKLDLVVVDRMVGINLIENNKKELGKISDYEFLDPALGMRDCYLMLPRSLPESECRVKEINASIQLMREDGQIEKIMGRHGFK